MHVFFSVHIFRFEGGQHGCYWGFDGPGGVLAHAFFPTDGRAHFDEAETFTDKTTKGTNLFWVRLLFIILPW